MSKKIKTIIWSSIALVVLIAVTLVLVFTAPNEEKDTGSDVSVKSISLIKEERTNLESLYIKNELDEYTIELVGEEMWRVRDTMDFKQTSYMYDETVTGISTFSAIEEIEENCDDLSRYGLSDPKLTFEVKYKNGNSYAFNVGLPTADRTYYFLNKKGENTVYTVTASSISNLMRTRYSYLDATILEGFDEEDPDAVPTINRVEITRPDLKTPIVIDKATEGELGDTLIQQSYLVMREPQFALLAESKTETVIYDNFGLSAAGIVKAKPTEEDLKKYGFAEPTARFSMTYNDNSTVVLTLGYGFNAEDGFDEEKKTPASKIDTYFLMREGVNQIYTVSADKIAWKDTLPRDLIASSIILPNIVDIEGFGVTAGGKQYDIAFDPGEDVSDSSKYEATLNGKDVDMEQARQYLQLMMLTSAQDVYDTIPTGDPQITLVYRYRDGHTSTVKVFVSEDNTTILTLNDKTAFVGRSGFVNKVIKESEKLEAGKPLDIEW